MKYKINIELFISTLSAIKDRQTVIRRDMFTHGFDYYLAAILESRYPGGVILYDTAGEKFLFCHTKRIYDISGDVTDQYELRHKVKKSLVVWDTWTSAPLHRRRVLQKIQPMDLALDDESVYHMEYVDADTVRLMRKR